MPNATTLQTARVRKDDFRNVQIVSTPQSDAAPLAAGHVLLAIDRFALTANNITYAAFGERMKYWDFFPAPEGWGIIPVWGFADVVASAVEGVKVGERFYGYYPMSSHALLDVARVTSTGFIEGTALRQALAPVYNLYVRCATDPTYDKARENEQALLKPLFFTSWLIADMISDNQYYGAGTVILSSASSKTAYGTAHALKRLPVPRPRVLGLTSARNKAFTESLGVYDEVRTYDEIGALPTNPKAVYVDMSGDVAVRLALHTRFGDQLAYSCSVGGTHWENLGGAGHCPDPDQSSFSRQRRSRSARPSGDRPSCKCAWAPDGAAFCRCCRSRCKSSRVVAPTPSSRRTSPCSTVRSAQTRDMSWGSEASV